jgi:hypothetical protein
MNRARSTGYGRARAGGRVMFTGAVRATGTVSLAASREAGVLAVEWRPLQ